MPSTKTFCSICSAFCGLEVDVEDNRITEIRGDKSHPMSAGFTCSKGRHFHHLLTAANRISRAQRRAGDGWQELGLDDALDQIAGKLKALIAEHGPESVAVYCGNGVTFKALTMPAMHAFMKGIGSNQIYSSLTIDQPAKIISVGRHGVWAGGGHSFETANVLMLLGNNVMVSGLHGPGSIPGWDPGALKQEKARGLKLIVVDPRRTETARQADMYLPIKPGTDAVFLSAVISWILENGWEDAEFCAQFTDGLEALRKSVSAYTPTVAAAITGLSEVDIKAAAELFATSGRGGASSATGPDMAPHANLTEHLIYSLNSLCGRHNRAGDKVNPSLLTPDIPPIAAVVPWDFLPDNINPQKNTARSRVRGAQQLFGEMPTATLAEEILTPGKGQIKALLVIGGNPLLSIPDQASTQKALESLELCVCIDGRESDTGAAHADYLLPASYGLERVEMTAFNDIFWGAPFHHVSEAVVKAPGDAQPEYRYLAALAQRLGTSVTLPGGELDTANPPDEAAVLRLLFPEGSTRVPIDDIIAAPGGYFSDALVDTEVIPAFEGMEDRLRFMPDGVAEEFDLLAQSLREDDSDGFSHLLICRRNGHVYNSMCHEFPQAPAFNPAWLHPEDMADAGLEEGQTVKVASRHGEIQASVAADKTLRRGVLSMSHGFGSGAGGATIGRLLSTKESTDRYTHIPRMSAVPVRIAGV